MPGATLVGVTDTDDVRAKVVAERHGVPAFPDMRALLTQVEGVSIAVPTSAHYVVAKECLQAGVHVLVEKPIATTEEQGRELVELAGRHGCILQVGHVERFNPALLAARPYVKGPGYMESHRLSPFGDRGTDVDVVLDLMIHDLDILLSLELGAIQEVRAAGMSVLSSSNDIANARIAFSGGCVANLTASRVSVTRQRKLRVFQHDAHLSIDYHTRQCIVYRRQVDPNGRPVLAPDILADSGGDALTMELEAFLHSVATGSRPIVSGEDGTAALALAHRILDEIHVLTR
jgi:predicted dehydrogenase